MPSGSSGGNGDAGRIVVIGASAGGLEALLAIVPALPDDFPAPVCVVLHTAPNSPGRLATVLGRRTPLPVEYAADGAPLRAGHVYVAPADHHLLVARGVLRLTRGPRENRQRPAVDSLFRSAAYAYGSGAVGVVLTGALDDGAAGLWTIKDRGGVAIVQDPSEALFPSMPDSAREYVDVDHVEPLARIGPLLARLVGHEPPTERGRSVSKELEMLDAISLGDEALERGILEMGPGTPFTCPDCSAMLEGTGDPGSGNGNDAATSTATGNGNGNGRSRAVDAGGDATLGVSTADRP